MTGTKLKCDVIGKYYPFWWKITSGGKAANYQKATSIVELYAATGEDYIKETGETVLGSSGHALELKVNHLGDLEINTDNLKVVLIEENEDCYNLLKKVVERRWPTVSINEAEGPLETNSSNIFLLNRSVDEALSVIENLQLGNTIYYFDPLRSVEWKAIEQVASRRIKNFCQTGTEFLIFLFTSDWFLGRDDFASLPETIEDNKWSPAEKTTVEEADGFFGNTKWRESILNTEPIQTREELFLELYKLRLYKWFRYVLPMPFAPKENQLFHLILCSNYDLGVKVTKDFYASMTDNPAYLPGREPQDIAYSKFKKAHPEMLRGLTGNRRPLPWRILWRTIKYHEGGVCDEMCRDFGVIEPDPAVVQSALEWLHKKMYIEKLEIESAWARPVNRYRLNWGSIEKVMQIKPPPKLRPITPAEFGNLQWRKLLDSLEEKNEER